ncbi:hypothetical protein BKA70DRAFT_1243204 [Coprinopsis sp. MPI-PUGE-AT-0042]|nr:hypothetical protein BKA70DRAFT_1243204 [Coprinopsis sp. MPI-PUGE-AT-0042]
MLTGKKTRSKTPVKQLLPGLDPEHKFRSRLWFAVGTGNASFRLQIAPLYGRWKKMYTNIRYEWIPVQQIIGLVRIVVSYRPHRPAAPAHPYQHYAQQGVLCSRPSPHVPHHRRPPHRSPTSVLAGCNPPVVKVIVAPTVPPVTASGVVEVAVAVDIGELDATPNIPSLIRRGMSLLSREGDLRWKTQEPSRDQRQFKVPSSADTPNASTTCFSSFAKLFRYPYATIYSQDGIVIGASGNDPERRECAGVRYGTSLRPQITRDISVTQLYWGNNGYLRVNKVQ